MGETRFRDRRRAAYLVEAVRIRGGKRIRLSLLNCGKADVPSVWITRDEFDPVIGFRGQL